MLPFHPLANIFPLIEGAARKVPGWIQKPLACDFIAYAFIPSRTCLLLPTLTLQRSWRIYGRDWIEKYPAVRANNGRYITTSIPVPRDILLKALSDATVVVWGEE